MPSQIPQPLPFPKSDEPRWQEISKDPNAPEVLAARQHALKRARTQVVEDRVAYLCQLAHGKRVLDIGVVEHFLEASSSERWLHGQLCKVAKTCIGVDILTNELQQLRQLGYDVRNADIMDAPLDEKFDLIVMGELIEHIDEPGRLLRSATKMLEDEGLLVLTTPNPWYVNVMAKNVLSRAPFTDSADHVGWYDASTLYEMGQRCGLQLYKYTGVRAVSPRTISGKILFGMAPALSVLGLNQLLFAKTVIYEFRRR